MVEALQLNVHCEIFQSNHEGEIIDKLHKARKESDGVLINAGAYTHYSYAIRDAIAAIKRKGKMVNVFFIMFILKIKCVSNPWFHGRSPTC